MFRRKSSDDSAATLTPETEVDPARQAKGRPTPTRKEAEAARKAALTATTDPKAAKRQDRDARRKSQVETRAALVSGDENRLPARDRGPIKGYVRDVVDGRVSAGELFIPVAVVVLVLGFVRVPVIQVTLLWVWSLMLVGVVVDSLYLTWKLRKGLAERFPEADAKIGARFDDRGKPVFGTKGAIVYGVIRSLQIRMMRLPKPKLRWNGTPVVPKGAKAAKG